MSMEKLKKEVKKDDSSAGGNIGGKSFVSNSFNFSNFFNS